MNLLEVGLEQLRTILGTDMENGLSSDQVLKNRQEFGENVLFEKKNTVIDFVKRIFGDIMMILFFLVSFFDYLATGRLASLLAVVLVILLYSAFVLCTHFYSVSVQQKVEKYSRSKYHVRRDGRIRKVSKSELVPGDILLLEKGDVMPCDGIILKHSALKILEASVTGTRVPVFKRSHEEVEEEDSGFPYFECILFAGSVILHGSAKVFVCNTGRNIFDNQNFTISRQNSTVPRIYQTAMELRKQIFLVWVVTCFFLFVWGVFRGQDVFSAFQYVSAVVIAAFPDSIEHLCDLSIAYMTNKLFGDGVVLRNAGSVDRLGDVNCVFVNSSDYLFYSQPIPNFYYLGEEHFDFRENSKAAAPLLENLLLAQSSKDYFSGKREEWLAEKAILSAAAQMGIQKNRLEHSHLFINRYDFDPRYGYSCALTLFRGKYRLVIRGNPNSVLSVCSEYKRGEETVPLDDSMRAVLRADARHLTGVSERVFAVATLNLSSPSTGDQRSLCRGMTYLGVFGLSTPVSASAANAVNICQKSGVQTYLLTDDYPETVASLSKSVSIIGENDYQYALSYQTYERMDRGVFVADIEKYKAYWGFPVEEKQNIVKFHKDNGDITLSLTGGLYDTLPQMESDISVVSVEEKQNAVRLNADILVKDKKYELVPLCINWARLFYRNIVHIMQYVLLIQVALGFTVFISFSANGAFPFHYLPLLLAGLGAVIPVGMNIFHRTPGPRLEDNEGVLKDDRVASLQVLIIFPFITGISQAIATMLARQIALYASGGEDTAGSIALITFVLASYFSSLSIKFDRPIFFHWKDLGKISLVTALLVSVIIYLVAFSPMRLMWQTGRIGTGITPLMGVISLILSLIPTAIMEWMKFLKKDDSAHGQES